MSYLMRPLNRRNFPDNFIQSNQSIAAIDLRNLIDMPRLLQDPEIKTISEKMLSNKKLEPEEVELLGNHLMQELKIQNIVNQHFYDEHYVYSVEMSAIDTLSGDSVFGFRNDAKAHNRMVLFDGTGHGESAHKSSLIFQFALHLMYEVAHLQPEDEYLEQFTDKLIDIFGDSLGGAMFLDAHHQSAQMHLYGNLSAYHVKLLGRGKKAKAYPVLEQTSQSIGIQKQRYRFWEFKPTRNEIYLIFTDGFLDNGGRRVPPGLEERSHRKLIKQFLAEYYSNPSHWLTLGLIPAFKQFMAGVGVILDDDVTVATVRRR